MGTGNITPAPHTRHRASVVIGIIALLALMFPFSPASSLGAGEDPASKLFDCSLGGYLKVRGAASFREGDSLYSLVGARTYYDGSFEGRLASRFFLGPRFTVDAHYELVCSGGDSRRKSSELLSRYPVPDSAGEFLSPCVNDRRRLMNLTKELQDYDGYTLYHRVDRLVLSYHSPRGLIARIGRQAVTWGNGLLFNPLDLFNPFAPTDIEREYKIGDDLVFLEHALPKGNLQLLYVPRRDPATGAIEAKEDSAAGKLHIPIGTTEFDVVLAEHFKDRIAGIGGAGYVGNAAWRCDAVWTFINESYERSDCLSLVANIDYSWEWYGKNLYGFLEFYYNGLGDNDYEKAIGERAVAERLLRGDLYTVGRYYLGGSIRVELDPLVNFTMTIISNMEDPSGVVQPSLMWDVSASMRITVGASRFWGAEDTEYGGFRILGTSLRYERADSLYIWAAFYF